ncbi:MAG: hypothetical protein OKBPIBMD_01516 [Chlorobi bacterium]|nr:MAG: hypothetical protein UZ06_CHB003000790 [Chlorobi bacterium OLB6]MBV6464065.1 hypothetical protein [Chlorobiota bacterium]MBW7853732.1 glycosyltransferase family 39 protein [Candidatus Kapabacteria bacterium]MCC6331524.1 glycosyltransferase family 39 protein [Ignavibacteria bacterium]MBZ0194224.1 glycosyltransferase family 39 protein [Candidatus Kapabacteria bacterium]
MQLTSQQHTIIATVLLIAVAYLTRIGGVEIQPWDEGLYAVRANAIAQTGQVVDQSEHTLGGLYSAIPAPLVSWQSAAGISIFGKTALGVRFFTVAESAAAMLLVYLILMMVADTRMAVYGTVFLGTALHWVVYSRQAMQEVPLAAFSLLTLWGVMRIYVLRQRGCEVWHRQMLLATVAAGTGLGFAMLSKLTVGVLPVLFTIPLFALPETRKTAVIVVLTGLGIALPWYVSMALQHGAPFLQALSLHQVTTAVEGNSRSLGLLYYVNQLLVAQPFVLVALLLPVKELPGMVRLLFTTGNPQQSRQRFKAVIYLWLVCTFIPLTVAATKNPHYTVMILPPAILAAVVNFERIIGRWQRSMTLAVFMILLMIACWAYLPGIRHIARSAPLEMLPWLLFAAAALIVPLILPARITTPLAVRMFKPVIIILIAAGAISSAQVIWNGRPEDVTGGREVALRLTDSGMPAYGYVYHRHNDADSLNPQIAWYLQVYSDGKAPLQNYTPVALPETESSLDVVAQLAVMGKPVIVYYHPSVSKEVQTEVVAGLAALYNVEWTSEEYTYLVKN